MSSRSVANIIIGSRSAHLKIKILIIELKKLVLLCQHRLHMKPSTSLYSVIQQCQTHYFFFVFYVFYCDLKEIYHTRRNINCKIKSKFICGSIIIILIYQKLGSVGPVQQKIKLPSSNSHTLFTFMRTILYEQRQNKARLGVPQNIRTAQCVALIYIVLHVD